MEGRLEEFGTWDDENNSASTTSTAGNPLLPLDISSSSSSFDLSSPIKGLGSKNELVIRRGDIIKVLSACNPDGSCRRIVPRRAQRLETGFLDANVPIHDPFDDSTWWIGTIIKRNKKDTRRLTGRFPQRCVALMTELRAKNLTFRCKMCSRMMQSFTKNTILNDFGITGSANQLFGKQDLCVACGPKILRVVQSVAQSLVKQNSDREILAMLRQIARKKLIHETAQEAYALTPERVPRAPPARRPENLNVNRGTGAPPSVPSPRANNVNVRPSDSPPPFAMSSSLGTSSSTSNMPQPPQQQHQPQRNNNNNRRRTQRSKGRKRNNTPKRTNQYDNAPPMVPETSALEMFVPEISIPKKKSLEDTLLPGLEVIFKNCCTREGHLTKEHIVRMVQRLAKDHQEAQDFKCTLDTAGVIIHALDSDGNGTIEYQEWSEWIVKGAKKSVQQREQMKGTSEILKKTVVFLEVICAIATKISARPDIETLRDSLVAMFQDAMQPDTDGHLWPVDIIAMNDKLSKKYPDIAFVPAMNKQVSETIVQSLDSDGNGSVELDEFVPWLMKGMSKTKEQRQQFAAQGETFQILIQFMESMTEVATQMTKKVNRLKLGLEVIFKNCCTREGHLTKEHIVRMVQRLAKDHQEAQDFKCTLDTAGVIIHALDSDGNGTIEYQEWSEWIVKGAKKSVQQREQMKGTSEILKKTVVFLEVICAIATKISARPDIETLRDSLVAMFQDAMQPDTDGHLWPVDIIAMNDKLSKKYPDIAFVPAMNKQVSETIVQSLDSDGNGSVELDEFVPWLMKGMSKTKEQRQQFAAQGETFQILIQFMESMTEVATQMNKKVNRLKPGLTQLFTKYDTTGEGMSSKDIYAMVTDLSSQYTKYANDWNEETSTLIVDALDVDEVRNHLHRQSTVVQVWRWDDVPSV